MRSRPWEKVSPAVFFQAQRFVFGGAETIHPTEKKLKNIAALARVCGFRATVRCSRKAGGWRVSVVTGTKRFELSHVLYTQSAKRA
jgi:hypothetical protein